MIKALLLFARSLRRIAAALTGCQQELKRIGDILELQSGAKGVSLRTFYADGKPDAVEDAALYAQTDAEFAALEQAAERTRRAGREIAMDEEV